MLRGKGITFGPENSAREKGKQGHRGRKKEISMCLLKEKSNKELWLTWQVKYNQSSKYQMSDREGN